MCVAGQVLDCCNIVGAVRENKKDARLCSSQWMSLCESVTRDVGVKTAQLGQQCLVVGLNQHG